METCTLRSIQISDLAKSQLARLGVGDEKFLRITVVSGGCAGNTYSAAVDDTLAESDRLVYQEGRIRVIADPQSAPYLDGLRIDYSDDLVLSGFRLKNPGAVKSCGCGASFTVLSPLGSTQRP